MTGLHSNYFKGRLLLSRITFLLGTVIFVWCSGPHPTDIDRPTLGSQEQTFVQDETVSMVNNEAISKADIEQLVGASDLDPSEALLRLQSERLLMLEAERRGFDKHPDVQRTAKQALVQSLIIEELEKLTVTRDEIEKSYRDSYNRYHRPEIRKTAHVVARMRPNVGKPVESAGKRFARKVIQEFSRANSVEDVLKRYENFKHELFEVGTNTFPSITADSPYAPEYKEAVLNAPVGVIPDPIRTRYGWYAIVVTEIVPEKTIDIDAVAEELRAHIIQYKRDARLKELIEESQRHIRVVRNESAVKRMLVAEIPDEKER